MSINLASPKVGMVIRNKRKGTLYQISIVESDAVYICPYWEGVGSRSTWKTRDRLWIDYYRVDDTSVTGEMP